MHTRSYTALGFPALGDSLSFYPLAALANKPAPKLSHAPILEEQIVEEGRTILGTCSSYGQATTLCKAWRRSNKLRRTMIIIG